MPSWRQLWSIITRPIFLVSCIFYLFDALPVWVQNILWWNPLIHVTGLVRRGIYPGYDASYASPTQGYTAGRAMEKTTDESDYDDLSRFGEWDETDAPVPEDLA